MENQSERLERAHQRQPDRGEPRWPSTLAVIATLILSITLPGRLTLGANWELPGLALILLIPLNLAAPRRGRSEPAWHRIMAIAVIVIINVANVASLALIVHSILRGTKTSGEELILEATQIWLMNVIVFALWYWELDRGGPSRRQEFGENRPDFLFPQMAAPGIADPSWRPIFVDYLYLAFTNATAFSPTDTLPLTPWAKMLMLVQSIASLLTVAVVAARAVNVLS